MKNTLATRIFLAIAVIGVQSAAAESRHGKLESCNRAATAEKVTGSVRASFVRSCIKQESAAGQKFAVADEPPLPHRQGGSGMRSNKEDAEMIED